MSALGDVLELLHGARHRFRTVRAEVRQWSHRERRSLAVDALARSGRSHGVRMKPLSWPGGAVEPESETEETVSRLWVDRFLRWRLEHDSVAEGRRPAVTTVIDGGRWWLRDRHGRVLANEGDPLQSVSRGPEHLLDPSELIPALDLRVTGRTRVAGRPALHVLAVPRHSTGRLPLGAILGGDECELAVDAERGVVLRLECRIGGLPFSVDEMTAVAFDEPLADDLFRLDLLPGEQVEDARATSPRRVPIEEAARQAPFTVLLPRRVPEGAQMHVVLGPPWFGADDDTEVRIHYFLPDARHHLHLYETAARRPYPDDLEGERLERDGQVLHVWDPWDPHGAKGGLPRQVWLDRDGTRVQIQSDLRLDTLIEVALSLAPASTEPPRLFPAG